MMRLVERISATEEPAPLKDIVSRIRVPVLLIASNRSGERTIDLAFRRRIGGHAALWNVGDARHTGALRRHPAEYARRVVAFLRGAEREAGRVVPSPRRVTHAAAAYDAMR